ncbi:hypothetical protein WH47_06324 [Habropoda laboriosa]|uniref:Uncharacterized protein n=1 Tax=Habropoda laboriosa TaxID=597456 RepID=A0A0L7RCG9_9HYME|nr:hypothetical protein WH47_06324 [Habropoda laboriosa]
MSVYSLRDSGYNVYFFKAVNKDKTPSEAFQRDTFVERYEIPHANSLESLLLDAPTC